MKENPISVFATNATIIRDVTPTGKPKYVVKLNNNASDALDRVQACHDYRFKNIQSFKLLTDSCVFKGEYTYITFSMLPHSNTSINLITCRCEHSKLNEQEALELIQKGMNLAFSKVSS